MPLRTTYQKYILHFKFDAGTSRGVLKKKTTYFIKISQDGSPVFGLGECGPLPGLSLDDRDDFEKHLADILMRLKNAQVPASRTEVFELAYKLAGKEFPSIRFGLETALLDLMNGGQRHIFKNSFLKGKEIPINGLIWMGSKESMLAQVPNKIEDGFKCIKMKVGSINFEKECEILELIRKKYSADQIMLRVDANGAFHPSDALSKLQRLSNYHIHSIEQPIAIHQTEEMKFLCEKSPIPVALDEELIGVDGIEQKKQLLSSVKPHFIILKPTLVGGFQACEEWISIAEEVKIGWWLTSALESNIGLNAISQFARELEISGYQGLGTGGLYHNNIPSPLEVKNGYISYNQSLTWDLSNLGWQ